MIASEILAAAGSISGAIIHRETGNTYRAQEVVKMKFGKEWFDAVVYFHSGGASYCRAVDDFYGFDIDDQEIEMRRERFTIK
jgi:hypothetical protein